MQISSRLTTTITSIKPQLFFVRVANLTSCFFIGALLLYSQISTAGARDNDCAFWTAQFAQYHGKRLNVYKGQCKNGQAHGRGRVYSFDQTQPDEPAKDTYKGFFRKGVYFKDIPYEGKLLFNGRAVASMLGTINNDEVWLHTSIAEDEGVSICRTDLINIATDNYQAYIEDDELTKELILEALTLYSKHCPNSDRDHKIAVVEEKYAFHPTAEDPIVYAKINLSKKQPFISYRNFALEQNRLEREYIERQAKEEAEKAQVRSTLMTFLNKHSVRKWVSIKSLSKNAFLWENRNVVVTVSLQNMLTHNSAIVSSTSNRFERVLLSGIEPQYFANDDILAIVTVAGKIQENGQTYTHLKYRDHHECEVEKCYDLEFAELDDYFDKL